VIAVKLETDVARGRRADAGAAGADLLVFACREEGPRHAKPYEKGGRCRWR